MSELRQGWRRVPIGEVADAQYGSAFSMKQLTETGYPVFGANGQVGFFSSYTHEEPEVLVTCRGATCGTVNMSLPKSFVTSNSFVVRPRDPETLDKGFLRHVLRAADSSSYITGSAQPQITLANFNPYPIPLPPLAEQRRIVARLEAAHARSSAARDTLACFPSLIEKLRQSILAAAFRGDLTKDWRAKNPDVEPASELLKRIRIERRKRWEEAELAKLMTRGKRPSDDRWKSKYKEPTRLESASLPTLPASWAWASWAEVGFSQNGRPFPSAAYTAGGAKLLRPGNLHASGEVTWNEANSRFLPIEFWRDNPDLHIGGEQLVMNLTAQSLKDEFLGRTCLTSAGEACLLNQRLARLTPVLVSPNFVLWLFKSPQVRAQIDGLNSGSLIQHMFTSQVDEFALPVPPLSEQSAIADTIARRLGGLRAMRESLEVARARLDELDRASLSNAFRGAMSPTPET